LEFYGPLKDSLDVVLEKFGEVKVKKIWFIEEKLPLFLKLSFQQLHEVIVKNSASTDYQYLYLKQAKLANLHFFVI
jgi:hypothetical protein